MPDSSSLTPNSQDAARSADDAKRIADLEAELAQARIDGRQAQSQLALRTALDESRAIDPEVVTALAAKLVTDGAAPDISAAVREVKRRRPALFAQPVPTGAMSVSNGADGAPSSGASAPADLARRATATGDRRDLLEYLRARRSVA